jgi:hypothetical protein
MDAVVSDLERVIADREVDIERVGPGESSVSRPVAALVRKRRRARRKAAGLSGMSTVFGVAAAILIGIGLLHLFSSGGSSSRNRSPRSASGDEPMGPITHTADGRPLDSLKEDTAGGREEIALRDDIRATPVVMADAGVEPAAKDEIVLVEVRDSETDEIVDHVDDVAPVVAELGEATVEDMIAATKGNANLLAAAMSNPYPEVTEAVGFFRPGVWEKGALVLRDGGKLQGEFRAEKGGLSFRKRPASEPRSVSLAKIEDIAFQQPDNDHARMGVFRLKQDRLDEALARFEKALAVVRDDPFVRKKIADIMATRDAQRKIDVAAVAGDHGVVLREMGRLTRVRGADHISSDRMSAFEKARRAGVGNARRRDHSSRRHTAGRAGVTLPWDEKKAPRYLAEALKAAQSGKPASEVVELFVKALAAKTPFEDHHLFVMAKACRELGKKRMVKGLIAHMSNRYRDRPEVKALLLGLGADAPQPGR